MDVCDMFTLVMYVTMVFTGVEGLICPPCERIHCSLTRSQMKCPGGLSTGVCDCCPACAKIHGQKCGGDWNYLGKCDEGLICQPDPLSALRRRVPTGRCVKGLSNRSFHKDASYMLHASYNYCQPLCTVEYCIRHPRAICSARQNAENAQRCQGPCDHTSCRACQFTNAEPRCESCDPGDFSCFRRFGRCIKKRRCLKPFYPCKLKDSGGGIFKCLVPECPENVVQQ
ncbi:uncharacterized protein LOC141906306 [Tubulanus polymorphus]|uniref:uncharacterized protein LOC141906306 n=1 Tax=Tubulanus polymorphus TaxID=672921 RepID=UPI003DA3A91D